MKLTDLFKLLSMFHKLSKLKTFMLTAAKNQEESNSI